MPSVSTCTYLTIRHNSVIISIMPSTHGLPAPDEAEAFLNQFPNMRSASLIGPGKLALASAAHLAQGMHEIPRSQVAIDGTHQSNAAHTLDMTLMGIQLAGSRRPDLDVGRVALGCTLHDLLELYSGDTPINNELLLETKAERDAAGLALLIHDEFANNQVAKDVLLELKANKTPMAHFVHALDGFEPLQFDIMNKGATYREHGDTYDWLVREKLRKTVEDETIFGLTKYGLQVVASKWDDWGCPEFPGDRSAYLEEEITRVESSIPRP